MESSSQEWILDEEELGEQGYCSYIIKRYFSNLIMYRSSEFGIISYWPSIYILNFPKNAKLTSSGNWILSISQVEKYKFSNRKQFDAFIDIKPNTDDKDTLVKAPAIDKITMRQVLAKMSISPFDENIFDQEMIDIMGGECSDDETNPETGAKICTLRDFKWTIDQQDINITAKRGNFFIYIYYVVYDSKNLIEFL